MCEDAATVLERQASREYGFGEGVYATPRATEHCVGLPSNNLDAEFHLTVFSKRAPVAKFRNKKIIAKGMLATV